MPFKSILYQAAKSIAAAENKTVGQVISGLLRPSRACINGGAYPG